jgi:hypothetical protein
MLIAKSEGKEPFDRPRRRCEDNIKIDLTETGCEQLVNYQLLKNEFAP